MLKKYCAILATMLAVLVCSSASLADDGDEVDIDPPPVYRPEATFAMELMEGLTFRQMYGLDSIGSQKLTAQSLMKHFEKRCDDLLAMRKDSKDLKAAKEAFKLLQKRSRFGNGKLKNERLIDILQLEPTGALKNAYDTLQASTGKSASKPLGFFPTRKLEPHEKQQLERFLNANAQWGLGEFTLEALCSTPPDTSVPGKAESQVAAINEARESGVLPKPCDIVECPEEFTLDANKCCYRSAGYTCQTGNGYVCYTCTFGRCCMGISNFCAGNPPTGNSE